MGIFDDQAERLLRTRWKDPNQLAQEIYSIWTARSPIQISSPLQIQTGDPQPAVTITNTFGGNGNAPGLLINGGSVYNGPTVYGDNVFSYSPGSGPLDPATVTNVYFPANGDPTPIPDFAGFNPTIANLDFNTPDGRDPFTPTNIPTWPPIGFPPPPEWVNQRPTDPCRPDPNNPSALSPLCDERGNFPIGGPPPIGPGVPTSPGPDAPIQPSTGGGTGTDGQDGQEGPTGNDGLPGSLTSAGTGGAVCVGKYVSGSGGSWQVQLYLNGFGGAGGPTVNCDIPDLADGEKPDAGAKLSPIVAVPKKTPDIPSGDADVASRFWFYYQPPTWIA